MAPRGRKPPHEGRSVATELWVARETVVGELCSIVWTRANEQRSPPAYGDRSVTGTAAASLRRHWPISSALLRYLCIGVLSIGVDVGLLVLLHQELGVSLAVATTAAYGTSLVVNFYLNRIVMASRGRDRVTAHLLRYAVLVVVNYGITLLVVTSAASFGVRYLVAKLAVVVAAAGWNFILYRKWVFAPSHGSAPAGARSP